MAVCRFSNTGDDWYVLVGVAKDLILNPRSVAGGFVYTYKLVNNGEKLEFLHKVGTSGSFGSWVVLRDLFTLSHGLHLLVTILGASSFILIHLLVAHGTCSWGSRAPVKLCCLWVPQEACVLTTPVCTELTPVY